MSKVELGVHIHRALRHSLREQEKLLNHKSATMLLPAIQKVAKFNLELEEWYSAKFHLRENDRLNYFLKCAAEIEAETARISEEIWQCVPVSLVPHLERVQERRAEMEKGDSYPKSLRAQFNNFRISLLEQVAGARFLENNNDLGEEVERIFLQYLNRRLGSSVRVVRGGHLFDYEGNRSDQIDIIVMPTNALGLCPSETEEGKYNVMVDQVIAAISITSTLTCKGFRERVEALRRIPDFKKKTDSYPGLNDQAWPLTYIVGAECEDLEAIDKQWRELEDVEKAPDMVLVFDSGAIIKEARKLKPLNEGDSETMWSLLCRQDIYAGLGFASLEIQIATRNWWMTGLKATWLDAFRRHLETLGYTEPLIRDPKHDFTRWAAHKIHGILKWGHSQRSIHNRLCVMSVFANESNSVIEATLTDKTKPISKRGISGHEFEPRWFKRGVHQLNGDYCALEEWIDPHQRHTFQRRISVFDSRTGEEVTNRLVRPILECAELAHLNPVLKPEP